MQKTPEHALQTTSIKRKNMLAEIAGWYGMLAILAAYLLVSFDVVASSSLAFQLLNLSGAIGIIVISLHKRVVQSVVLNIVWVVIALAAIARMIVA